MTRDLAVQLNHFLLNNPVDLWAADVSVTLPNLTYSFYYFDLLRDRSKNFLALAKDFRNLEGQVSDGPVGPHAGLLRVPKIFADITSTQMAVNTFEIEFKRLPEFPFFKFSGRYTDRESPQFPRVRFESEEIEYWVSTETRNKTLRNERPMPPMYVTESKSERHGRSVSHSVVGFRKPDLLVRKQVLNRSALSQGKFSNEDVENCNDPGIVRPINGIRFYLSWIRYDESLGLEKNWTALEAGRAVLEIYDQPVTFNSEMPDSGLWLEITEANRNGSGESYLHGRRIPLIDSNGSNYRDLLDQYREKNRQRIKAEKQAAELNDDGLEEISFTLPSGRKVVFRYDPKKPDRKKVLMEIADATQSLLQISKKIVWKKNFDKEVIASDVNRGFQAIDYFRALDPKYGRLVERMVHLALQEQTLPGFEQPLISMLVNRPLLKEQREYLNQYAEQILKAEEEKRQKGEVNEEGRKSRQEQHEQHFEDLEAQDQKKEENAKDELNKPFEEIAALREKISSPKSGRLLFEDEIRRMSSGKNDGSICFDCEQFVPVLPKKSKEPEEEIELEAFRPFSSEVFILENIVLGNYHLDPSFQEAALRLIAEVGKNRYWIKDRFVYFRPIRFLVMVSRGKILNAQTISDGSYVNVSDKLRSVASDLINEYGWVEEAEAIAGALDEIEKNFEFAREEMKKALGKKG